MARHPAIARTLYPALPDSPGHDLAARQMNGFGGIVTIEVDGDGAAAACVADRLQALA